MMQLNSKINEQRDYISKLEEQISELNMNLNHNNIEKE